MTKSLAPHAAARTDAPAADGATTSASSSDSPSSSSSRNEGPSTSKKKAPSASAKRARRSEIERQSRQRRQGSVAQMRGELEQLERSYAQLVHAHADGEQVEAARRRFLPLAAEARELREQQKRLRAMLHERQLFRDSSRALASEFSDTDAFPWSAVAHAAFEPLAPTRCFEIMRESLETIQRFEVRGDAVSSGASYFGWADKRRLDAETSSMHFTFTKRIPSRSAEFLVDKSWTTFCDEENMRRSVFSAAVRVNLEVLQVVNEDVCVLRRHTTYVAMGKAFHTVYLLFRVQTESGYKLCFRTIPAPEIQNSLEPHEAWIDIFHWTNLTRLVDEHGDPAGTEIEFGGSIGAGVMKFAMHWMLELAMTVVRWENACVAPMAIKPAMVIDTEPRAE